MKNGGKHFVVENWLYKEDWRSISTILHESFGIVLRQITHDGGNIFMAEFFGKEVAVGWTEKELEMIIYNPAPEESKEIKKGFPAWPGVQEKMNGMDLCFTWNIKEFLSLRRSFSIYPCSHPIKIQ